MTHFQIHFKKIISEILVLSSPILIAFCLFFSCGKPPGQDVIITINQPPTNLLGGELIPVHISFRMTNGGNTFLTKVLAVGENQIFLPKGTFQVSTGFFGQSKTNHENPFFYAKVEQEVEITKQAHTVEVHYPQIIPVQYKKYGLVFKEQRKSKNFPLANVSIVLLDPFSQEEIKNPSTGESISFLTDANGRASVDLPILEEKKSYLMLQKLNNQNIYFEIPAEEEEQGMQFYELISKPEITLNVMSPNTHYLSENQTIEEILATGKNPRFVDMISKNAFQFNLNQQVRSTHLISDETKLNLIAPIQQTLEDVHSANVYIRHGRQFTIQCKSHDAAKFELCPAEVSIAQLKQILFDGQTISNKKTIDLLILDQDGYSIFTDKESTKDTPSLINLTLF